MELLSAWKCFCLKTPSSTQKPRDLFSMTSSSTRLEPMEIPALTPLPLIPSPDHLNNPNHQKHLLHPRHQRCLRNKHTAPVSPCQGGIPHLAALIPHPIASHHPIHALFLAAISPPPAPLPPTTPTHILKACPPPPLHLSCAGPGVGQRVLAPSTRSLGKRSPTFVHPPPLLTSPSLLHHHPG